MEVILAGYNLDTSTIAIVSELAEALSRAPQPESLDGLGQEDLAALARELLAAGAGLPGRPITPETIAVAYARISRDPAPVTELRERALADVESARRSAKSIVFEMNHQSVAEHAVFNFDILGISRLAVERLQWHRLCSFTEKSQRYQKLEGDYVVPAEFGEEAKALYVKNADAQNAAYHELYPRLFEFVKEKYPEKAETKAGKRDLLTSVKEDARYVVGLGTHAQMGFTSNARNMEYIIRCLRAEPLAEVRELGERFYKETAAVAPSLILLTDPVEYEKEFGIPLNDDHFMKTHPHTREFVEKLFEKPEECAEDSPPPAPRCGDASLVWSDPDTDVRVAAAILHSHSGRPMAECLEKARSLMESEQPDRRWWLMKEFMKHSHPWESATREFEVGQFMFEVNISSAAFGQMKRHRMCTQLVQDYDPALGATVPPLAAEAGLEDELRRVYDESAEVFRRLATDHPSAAAYALCNGHRRRMLLAASPRELYHMARLREDAHAQWDIRQLTGDMLTLAREAAPVTLMLACGKDSFNEARSQVYGG